MKNSNMSPILRTLFVFLLICTWVYSGYSQINNDSSLFDNYKNYSKLPRETAFAHLNKSTLIEGETLGFSVYLFDKYFKTPSLLTRNVYCTIESPSGKILKQKMILANNGVASGSIEIDSTFKSGNYVFKAYTNWMKNFDEHNYYSQYVKIINPDDYHNEQDDDDDEEFYDLDAQFLPEGGHLLLDTKNTVGVVIKDDYGFGVPNLKGLVTNSSGEEITSFETNAFGISKFEFTPQSRQIYNVSLNDQEQTKITLDTGKPKGLNMSLVDLQDKIALVFRTNDASLPQVANKTFKLAISNGSRLNVTDINFKNNREINTVIEYANLYSGINIITLFDSNNKPLLERLFFKHEGITKLKLEQPVVTKIDDSLRISIPASQIDKAENHNLSISVLPKDTKSYNHHHNILSYTFLKPYVKGRIENATYYFTNTDKKKAYELDNLLLTQGWSSYDWHTIFNNEPNLQFEFEDGVSIKANVNNTKGNTFIVYPQQNTPTLTVEIKDGDKSFDLRGLLPVNKETLEIGVLNSKNQVVKPGLYVQFSPKIIPDLNRRTSALKYKNNKAFKYDASFPILDESWKKIESLDTVLISAKVEEDRIEKIKRFNKGRVDVFSDIQRKNTVSFAAYIGSKGFSVFQDPRDPRSLLIENPRRVTWGLTKSNDTPDPTNPGGGSSANPLPSRAPIIYLNNQVILDFRVLMDIDMSTMDYVIVDRQGLGEGIRGADGVIKIFTNPKLRTREYEITRDAGQVIDVPLSFSVDKTFYTPTYSSYKNDFFINYGVIDWISNALVNDNGHVTIKIKDTKTNQIKLYIEGATQDGAFISEEKIITVN